MGRQVTGSLYQSRGTWFLALTLGKRVHIRLATCKTETQAQLRRQLVVSIAQRLRAAGNVDLAVAACRQAGEATDELLPGIVTLTDGLIGGTERVAEVTPAPAGMISVGESEIPTFKKFGDLWTSSSPSFEI